ncbi:MAG: Na+/H+ antiporter NhaC, partial [Psychroserpens sp.]
MNHNITSRPTPTSLPKSKSKQSLKSLLPFGAFLAIFLGTGIVLTLQGVDFAFYQLPASIAIIPAILLAIYMGRETVNEQISQFIAGAGHQNIITMCII